VVVLERGVLAHPYAEWAAQQIVQVVAFDTWIARLIRDGDRIYGARFDARFRAESAPRTQGRPFRNGHAARE